MKAKEKVPLPLLSLGLQSPLGRNGHVPGIPVSQCVSIFANSPLALRAL
jgi:hypothetical protein